MTSTTTNIFFAIQNRGLKNQTPLQQKAHIAGSRYFPSRWELHQSLKGHQGCVNSVVWNETGELLLSGSDDCHLNIWSPFSNPSHPLVHSIPSGHTSNIFSAHFLPCTSSRQIVSCSSDGIVRHTDLASYLHTAPAYAPPRAFTCHSALTYEVLTEPENPHVFYDCSDDATVNRYDLRVRTYCECDGGCRRHTLIDMSDIARREGSRRHHGANSGANVNTESTANPSSHPYTSRLRPFLNLGAKRAITAISLHPRNPVYLAAGCADECVRIWDQRSARRPVYKFVPGVANEEEAERQDTDARQRSLWAGTGRITSLRYDPEGRGELLVSYSKGEVCLVKPGLEAEDKGRAGKGGKRVKEMMSTEEVVTHELTTHRKEKVRKDSGVVVEGGRGAREGLEVQNLDAVEEVAGEASVNTVAAADKETSILQVPIPKQKGQELEVMADVQDTEEEEMKEVEDESEEDTREGRIGAGIGENEEEEDDEEYDGYLWAKGGEKDVVMKYKGHRNERTVIKEANFYGPHSEFILSGSDDRRVFIWNRKTAEIVGLLEADNSVVNCVQPHPHHDPILATSGIDDDVKLWYPTREKPCDLTGLDKIVRRNAESGLGGQRGNGRVLVMPTSVILQLFAAGGFGISME